MKAFCILVLIAAAALVTFGQTADEKRFKDESEVPRITLEDAKKAFDDGSAVFIDARAVEIYKSEHIKGAISIPYSTEGTNLEKVPKGKRIIVYCS